nr:DUF6803 family protein [Neobacillus dielmonensis]
MALLDLGIIFKKKSALKKLKIHAIFVGMFLIISHIAMIFGMVDPALGSSSNAGHNPMNM